VGNVSTVSNGSCTSERRRSYPHLFCMSTYAHVERIKKFLCWCWELMGNKVGALRRWGCLMHVWRVWRAQRARVWHSQRARVWHSQRARVWQSTTCTRLTQPKPSRMILLILMCTLDIDKVRTDDLAHPEVPAQNASFETTHGWKRPPTPALTRCGGLFQDFQDLVFDPRWWFFAYQ
jgi:hypothetical protein